MARDDMARLTGRQRRAWVVALGLTWFRLGLAPVFVVMGIRHTAGTVAAVLLVLGFLSDVFDGIIARRGNVATAGLRHLDSIVDTYFYLGVGACALLAHGAALRPYAWLIGLVLVTEVVHHVIPRVKYGKTASFHAWSAKCWGAALFAALFWLFASGRANVLPYALALGLVAHAEIIAMTLLLPEWTHDVRSVAHALRIRREGRG